jgi:hypothetical protein
MQCNAKQTEVALPALENKKTDKGLVYVCYGSIRLFSIIYTSIIVYEEKYGPVEGSSQTGKPAIATIWASFSL